jgi:hypothetical protein
VRLGFSLTWFSWALFASSSATAADFTCPASVSVRQTVVNVPTGWEGTSGSDAPHFDRVSFYLKHPKDGGALVPDRTEKRSGVESVTWNFVRGPRDEFWLGCLYTGTTVILAQRLNTNISQCVVQYDLLPSGVRLRLKIISCK